MVVSWRSPFCPLSVLQRQHTGKCRALWQLRNLLIFRVRVAVRIHSHTGRFRRREDSDKQLYSGRQRSCRHSLGQWQWQWQWLW